MNITIDEAHLADTSIYVVYEGEESHFRLTEFESAHDADVVLWPLRSRSG